MRKIASLLGVVAAITAMPAVSSAQTFAPLNTTFDVSGTANLSHTVPLACTINLGDIKVTTRSYPSNTATVSGVARPFTPLIPCGAVNVPSYTPWLVELVSGSGGTYVAKIFVSARTITGSLCEGWINGTFTNGPPANFTGSGTIPVVSGPASPPNCTVSVNLNIPGLYATP